jgi:gas vesicle protein
VIPRDRSDLVLAALIGALAGAGAALLFRSGRRNEFRDLLDDLAPLRDDVHRRLRDAVGRGDRRSGGPLRAAARRLRER